MSFFSIFSRKKYCLMPIYIFKNKNVHSLITHYSHANILSKKRPFSQKHCALMSIKKKSWKTPCCHAYIWSKNVNSVKTILYYGPKKSIECPFLRFCTQKLLLWCAFLSKHVHSLKNTLFSCISCPYFVRKTSILSKTLCSHVKLFKIFMKNPLLPRPYLVKKRQFSQKYIIIWPNKSIG